MMARPSAPPQLSEAVQHRARQLLDAARDERIEELQEGLRFAQHHHQHEIQKLSAAHRAALEEKENALKHAVSERTSLAAKFAATQSTLSNAEATIQEQSHRLATQGTATQQLQAHISQLESTVQGVEDENTVLELKSRQLKTDLADATVLIGELQEQVRSLRRRPLTSSQSVQMPELLMSRNAASCQTEGEVNDAVTALESHLQFLKTQLKEAIDRVRTADEAATASIAAAERRVAEAERRTSDMQRAVEALNTRLGDASTAAHARQQLVEEELRALRRNVESLEDEKLTLSRRLERSQAELQSVLETLHDADDRCSQSELQANSLREALRQANDAAMKAESERCAALRAADDAALTVRRCESSSRVSSEEAERERQLASRAQAEASALRTEVTALREAVAKLEAKQAESQRNATESVCSTQQQLDAAMKRATVAESHCHELDAQWRAECDRIKHDHIHDVESRNARIEALEASQARLQETLRQRDAQIADLRKDTSTHLATASANQKAKNNELVELQLEVARACASTEKERSANATLTKRLAEVESRLTAATTAQFNAEQQLVKCQAEVRELRVAKEDAESALKLARERVSPETDRLVQHLRAELKKRDELSGSAVDEANRAAREERDQLSRRIEHLEAELAKRASDTATKPTEPIAPSPSNAATILELQKTVWQLQSELIGLKRSSVASTPTPPPPAMASFSSSLPLMTTTLQSPPRYRLSTASRSPVESTHVVEAAAVVPLASRPLSTVNSQDQTGKSAAIRRLMDELRAPSQFR